MNKSGSYSQNTSFTDDDEDAFDTPSKKVKTEKGIKKEGGVKKEEDLEAGRAYGFKAEENGDVIDVERDEYVTSSSFANFFISIDVWILRVLLTRDVWK